MRDSYSTALAEVLKHEGGYVNHPKDPGGATNRGVTQRVYDAFRRNNGLPLRSVKSLTESELQAIYRLQYWDAVKGDELPAGVDFAVFDFAVNSGPARAIKYLQMVLGVDADGNIGQVTIRAAAEAFPRATINSLCDKRLAFLKNLETWGTFGRGWTSRVAGVRAKALQMASQPATAPSPPPPPDVPPVAEPVPAPTAGPTIAKWVIGLVGAAFAAFAAWMMKG